jgi:hypothetical protein
MKVTQRDACYFVSFGKVLKGTMPGSADNARTFQPPYEDMGINVALPVGSYLATGFGVKHRYVYPKLETTVNAVRYVLKEEETVLTVPVAFGPTPHVSLGANLATHIAEHQLRNPPEPNRSGDMVALKLKLGALLKVSQKFKLGLTVLPGTLAGRGSETVAGDSVRVRFEPRTPSEFRLGVAMYPLRWFFFFSDLEYRRYPGNTRLQPGFYLGAQLTHYGRLLNLASTPEFGMLPVWVGYAHEPYNRATATQARYLSLGTGYFVNNIYVRWSVRFNAEPKAERRIVLGSRENSLRLDDYRLMTPVFLEVGYRF